MSESVDSSTGSIYVPSPSADQVICDALAVPYDAGDGIGSAIASLVSSVKRTLPQPELQRIAPVLDRLSALGQPAAIAHDDAFSLAADIYLLRALTIDAQSALLVLRARELLAAVRLPEADAELRMDQTVAAEQLSFAAIVHEPSRIPTTLAAADHFLRRYRRAYAAHHESYWQAMSRVHSSLLDCRPQLRALARLNSLGELGPPVGEQTMAAIEDLIREATGCPYNEDQGEALRDAPVCPGCAIDLDEEPPVQQAGELRSRLRRAIERQMARLSSVAVREVLEQSSDPRLDKFLRVIQASQLSSLVEIMDDQLTGYLRRYLLESRIRSILTPVLDSVERGETPETEEALDSMHEIARLLERAAQAARRGLAPPPESKGER